MIKKELTRNRLAIITTFFIAGLTNGIFFSNLPYIQDKLGVDYSQISMALLAATFGSFPSLFLAGYFIDKYGSRIIIKITSIAACFTLGLLFYSPTYLALLVFLFINGLTVGLLDVSMNSRAVKVENLYGKSIMSSFHAFYSIAGFVAAGWTKISLTFNLSYRIFIVLSTLLLLFLCFYSFYYLDPIDEKSELEEEKSILIFPKGILIGLAVLVFLAFISEGAIGDWAAIFLHKEQGLTKSTAAMGYGLFSLFMAFGRLTGDLINRKWGARNTLIGSSLLSALSLLLVIIIPSPMLSLLLIGMVGLGMANIVPILFSSAGNSGIMSPSKGIASVSMIGYLGFIIGPPLMGFIGDVIRLKYAFFIIIFFSLVIAITAPIFLKSGKQKEEVRRTKRA